LNENLHFARGSVEKEVACFSSRRTDLMAECPETAVQKTTHAIKKNSADV
jgi:hypothetical protein